LHAGAHRLALDMPQGRPELGRLDQAAQAGVTSIGVAPKLDRLTQARAQRLLRYALGAG
jgi:hypothetical protein